MSLAFIINQGVYEAVMEAMMAVMGQGEGAPEVCIRLWNLIVRYFWSRRMR